LSKRLYADEHERFVRDNCATMSKIELTILFNDRFGMNISLEKMKSLMANRHINSGRTGYFPKGHEPWNYGTKGQGLTGANCGSFEKGHTPANTRPLYSERVSKDGHIEIKVPERNPHTGCPTRFRHKHVWLYEQENGPVPKGHVVIFQDGDKRNFQPANLITVRRAELARLNQNGYTDAPAEIKPAILARARLQTKIGDMQRKTRIRKVKL
jgi:hypothetical protein